MFVGLFVLQSSPSLFTPLLSPQSSPSLSMPELSLLASSPLLAGSGGEVGFGAGGGGGWTGLAVGSGWGLLQSKSAIKQFCPFGQSL